MRRIALSLTNGAADSKRSLKQRLRICDYDNVCLQGLVLSSDETPVRRRRT